MTSRQRGHFGTWLLKARLEARLTQAALEEKAGIGDDCVSGYERGIRAPNLHHLRLLEEALGLAYTRTPTYPQFPGIEDCDQRLRLLEETKDRTVSEMLARAEAAQRAVVRLEAQVEVRREVHRDDYLRSAMLISALKQIIEMGGQAAKVAEEALLKVYGVTEPLGHCGRHMRYRTTCADCRAIRQSQAGTGGSVRVPSV
jgi:transcriptional regulator with XRE-family HTH domain